LKRHINTLSDRWPVVTPPADAFDGILARISHREAQLTGTGEVVPLRRAPGRRWALVAASALAACLGLAVVLNDRADPPVHAKLDCGKLYKDFWQTRDPQSYARISPEQLAGISRMVLRAYDACQAGDEQDARALLARLREHSGSRRLSVRSLPG
jgi:hypothetical protein